MEINGAKFILSDLILSFLIASAIFFVYIRIVEDRSTELDVWRFALISIVTFGVVSIVLSLLTIFGFICFT